MKQMKYQAGHWLSNLAGALILLLIAGAAAAAPTQQNAEIEQVRQSMGKLLGAQEVTSIVPSPIPGLYEVLVEANLYYVSADGKYLLIGNLVDTESREDLTTPKLAKVKAGMIERFGEDNMVIFAHEKYEHTITVFTDIDCGYCRKLHAEMEKYNDRGIRVRYLMYPRAGIGSASYQKAVNVFCADDKQTAMTRAKAGKKLEKRQCENSVAQQYDLGKKLGVNGTPAIFLEDGELVPGYVPAKRLAGILNQKAAK